MSGVDVLARNLARTAVDSSTRLRTVDRLRRGIARVGGRLPAVMTNPPTLAAQGNTALPAGWTMWYPSDNTTPDLYASRCYTLLGGTWQRKSPVQFDCYVYEARVQHTGNGTDPLANWQDAPGPRIRFASFAPVLDIAWQSGSAGYRLKIDGDYAQAGPIVPGSGGFQYQRVTWGDGSDANRKLRHYELEIAGNAKFVGVRAASIYPPEPWPAEDRLRMLVHGDSMVAAVWDSVVPATARLHGNTVDVIGNLCAQPDCWQSGVGGTGWVANLNGTASRFNERVDIDVIAPAPDVIWEMGGLNDTLLTTQPVLQALVETWLGKVTAALPNVVVLMAGPITPKVNLTGATMVRDAKAAAAAKFPRNVRFIDNVAQAWTTGTGKQGAVTSDGNADWVTGSDGTHPTADGHVHNGARFVGAAAAALEGWR